MRAERNENFNEPRYAEFRIVAIDHECKFERMDPTSSVTQKLLAAFHKAQHTNERTADAMGNKWAYWRARFTVTVQNHDKSRQEESEVFSDFASAEQIMSYMVCVFKVLPLLEIIMRQVENGIRD